MSLVIITRMTRKLSAPQHSPIRWCHGFGVIHVMRKASDFLSRRGSIYHVHYYVGAGGVPVTP